MVPQVTLHQKIRLNDFEELKYTRTSPLPPHRPAQPTQGAKRYRHHRPLSPSTLPRHRLSSPLAKSAGDLGWWWRGLLAVASFLYARDAVVASGGKRGGVFRQGGGRSGPAATRSTTVASGSASRGRSGRRRPLQREAAWWWRPVRWPALGRLHHCGAKRRGGRCGSASSP